MYVASDPRSKLGASAREGAKKSNAPAAPATYARFYETGPDEAGNGYRTWFAGAANFIVAHSEVEDGAVLERTEQPDEYVMLLPDAETSVTVEWDGGETVGGGHAIVIVPPGPSKVRFANGGRVVRLFTRRVGDIVEKCKVGHEDPHVPPLESWPDPVGGYKVRWYSMDVPQEQGRFGRLIRSRDFMVNYIYPRPGPRDRKTLSPHSHDDFQQCSLCLEGTYVHHLRWPWGTNAEEWRPDDHETCGAPSVAVIPATVLHTSEAVGQGTNFLVDVFCPPRHDFSRQPGWVLNAAEYPQPQE